MGLSGGGSHLGNLDERSFVSEFEDNLSVGQGEVEVSDQLNLVLKEASGLLAEEDFAQLGSVESVSESSADDVGGEDEILEEGVVDGSEGSVAGDYLFEVGLLIDNGSFRENEGMSVFLLLDLVDDLGDQSTVVLDENEREVDDQSVDGLLVSGGELEFSDVADQGVSGGLLVGAGVGHEIVDDLGYLGLEGVGGGLVLLVHRNFSFFIIFKAVYLVLKGFD